MSSQGYQSIRRQLTPSSGRVHLEVEEVGRDTGHQPEDRLVREGC